MEILRVSPLGVTWEVVMIIVAAIGIVLVVVTGMRLAFKSYDRTEHRH